MACRRWLRGADADCSAAKHHQTKWVSPQYPIDYEVANWFTSRYPTSRFIQNLIVARAGKNGERVSLMNRELVIRRGSEAEKRLVNTPDELLRVLADQFGLHFPSGTRFGPPGGAWPA